VCSLRLFARAVAWPGGQAVARYIFDNPSCVAGRRVLDVGAGGGVASLAALLAGAAHVTANDTDPLALACLASNARHNGLGEALTDGRLTLDTRNLLFGDGGPSAAATVAAALQSYDVVMAGDMCFISTIAASTQAVLAAAAARPGATALLGDPGRRSLLVPVPQWGLARVAQFEVTDADADPLVEGATRREVDVWRSG
jgi:predicted nicotinamide N-methyase